MTEEGGPAGSEDPAAAAAEPLPSSSQTPPPGALPSQPGHTSPPPVPQAYGAGPLGKTRGTGICILLAVVTLGIYPLVWFYKVHDELKRHRGSGLGGGLALLLAIVVGIVMPYITSSEIGEAYGARGQAKPVTGLTGLWYFPGSLLIVGPIVWFVKTNGALNTYWRSLGAV